MGYFTIPPFFNFCTMAEEKEKEPAQMDGLTEEEARFLEKLRKASPEIQQAVMAVLRSAEK